MGHNKLTEAQMLRMRDLYASAPLLYKSVDDRLFELDLIQFYDEDKDAVEFKHPSTHFYDDNGKVKAHWFQYEWEKMEKALNEIFDSDYQNILGE